MFQPCQIAKTVCFFALVVAPPMLQAQDWNRQGHPIGKVSTNGHLIVLELDEAVLGKEHLFNLTGRTLRFTPQAGGYRGENINLQWEPDFGAPLSGPEFTLHNFAFPFSGRTWNSFAVDVTGAITFGPAAGSRGHALPIARFDQLAEAAPRLVNSVPAICVFEKLRMSGARYVKELADRVVITWDVTEPFAGIQDFTWVKTVNRFQAVLYRSGAIEMSYSQLAARDAIVGIYPMLVAAAEKPLGSLESTAHPDIAAHLDIEKVRFSVIGNALFKVTFESRGPIPHEGEPGVQGIQYRVFFRDPKSSSSQSAPGTFPETAWTILGIGPWDDDQPANGETRYRAFGPEVGRRVTVDGNTISIEGVLPSELLSARQLEVHADVQTMRHNDSPQIVRQIPTQSIALTGLRNPQVNFASLKPQDGPFTVAYEAFHYLALPIAQDLTCSVIKTLGDKYDFLAYYSDFRIDNQEAGTPSDGPLGGNVTGIGQTQNGLDRYCSAGRFQWQYIQPVYVGSNQMQKFPPSEAKSGNDHNIDFYEKQLAERSVDGQMPAYDLATSQIAHEMGHRWSAFVSAKVNGETIVLGPTHWARGLQAPVAFPFQRPTEASIMGGGVWQDNFDGTFTQLDDDYYVPATGYSYLDLYLMGLISPAEVPDFFMLKNLVPVGKDSNGHPIFKADRIKITIQDVIAVEGPRTPSVENSQRKFNTGMVVVVEHGATPSPELIERTNGIREQWMEYWPIATGQRSSMTTEP